MAFDWGALEPDTTFRLRTEVPDNLKAPRGPYRQGPDGLWYYISIFGDPQPWKFRVKQETDPDYIKLFGPRPSGPSDWDMRVAVTNWEYNRDQFMGLIEIPQEYSIVMVNAAKETLNQWNVKWPVFYEHKIWGKMGRFLDTPVPTLDLPIYFLLNYPQHVVSTYQIKDFRENGNEPSEWHWMVPGFVKDPQNN